jgi:hypothetical protein
LLQARLTAQLLAGPPARDPVAVAERLLAVQGQDPRGFRLAVRARTEGVSAADVDRALTDERSLLVTWLNRGTLHLVRSEDYALLHAVTTPPLRTGSDRRLAQEGVPPGDAARGIATIERSLADEGPLNADELRERVGRAGVRAQGQALYHLLYRASLDGLIVRGPIVGGKHAYVLVRDWLGRAERVERAAALGEFARRYLAGHGPASDRDLARWAGIPLRDARAGLNAISARLDTLDGGLADLKGRPPAAGGRAAAADAARVVRAGAARLGLARGARGQAPGARDRQRPVSAVRARRGPRGGALVHAEGQGRPRAVRRLARADREALEREAADVERFLG